MRNNCPAIGDLAAPTVGPSPTWGLVVDIALDWSTVTIAWPDRSNGKIREETYPKQFVRRRPR